MIKNYKEILPTTANIGKRGDSGCIQHPVSVSAFSTADMNELRKPRQPILAKRLAFILKNDLNEH